MHVPEAGNQELAGPVYHLRLLRHLDVPADRGDAIAGHEDSHARLRRGTRPVDDRDVAKGERLALSLPRGQRGRRRRGEENGNDKAQGRNGAGQIHAPHTYLPRLAGDGRYHEGVLTVKG